MNYAFYNHFLKNRFSFLSLSWCWYVTCYTRLHMFGCISTPFVSNYLELKRNRSWNMRSYVKKYIFVLLDIQHYNWKCTHMCRFISIYDYVSEYKVFNWIKMWMMKPTWPHFIICWYYECLFSIKVLFLCWFLSATYLYWFIIVASVVRLEINWFALRKS